MVSEYYDFGITSSTKFIVKNIAPGNKTIKIFQYPILNGMTRDLLMIPHVSEADIRHSLLKGELKIKFIYKEALVVNSNIDLLQFNDEQKIFLKTYGVNIGTEINLSLGQGVPIDEHETLRQLIHFIDNGPGDGFASGALKETLPLGNPFPTSITWYLDTSKTTKLVEKFITYNNIQIPTTIQWYMYDTNGTTIIHTVTDTISYTNNVFETTRTRAIS